MTASRYAATRGITRVLEPEQEPARQASARVQEEAQGGGAGGVSMTDSIANLGMDLAKKFGMDILQDAIFGSAVEAGIPGLQGGVPLVEGAIAEGAGTAAAEAGMSTATGLGLVVAAPALAKMAWEIGNHAVGHDKRMGRQLIPELDVLSVAKQFGLENAPLEEVGKLTELAMEAGMLRTPGRLDLKSGGTGRYQPAYVAGPRLAYNSNMERAEQMREVSGGNRFGNDFNKTREFLAEQGSKVRDRDKVQAFMDHLDKVSNMQAEEGRPNAASLEGRAQELLTPQEEKAKVTSILNKNGQKGAFESELDVGENDWRDYNSFNQLHTQYTKFDPSALDGEVAVPPEAIEPANSSTDSVPSSETATVRTASSPSTVEAEVVQNDATVDDPTQGTPLPQTIQLELKAPNVDQSAERVKAMAMQQASQSPVGISLDPKTVSAQNTRDRKFRPDDIQEQLLGTPIPVGFSGFR